MATRNEILRFTVEVEGTKDVAGLAGALDSVTKAAAAGEPEAAALVDELEQLQQVGKAVNALAGLKARLQETGDNLFLAKRGLADLNAQFSATDRSSAAVNKAFKAAEKSVADLTRRERELEVAVQKASGTIAKHGLDVNNLTKAEQELQERTRGTVQAMREYVTAAESTASATKKVEKESTSAGNAFTRLRDGANSAIASLLRVTGIAGAVSTALGALGVGRFFGGAVSSATEFEAKLSEIRAVSGATSEQLARMRRAAEDATKTTKFSAAEAAAALGELARASGDADAAVAQLAPTLNLAQAAGIGAAESAQILTTTLTQFGLAADQAGRAADIFAREANSTNDTVSSLGLAMSYTAPLARQLGLTLEQTTAILGALAQEGFKGERAGTALRNVFSQLLDPTSKFRTELRGLNITGNDFGEIVTKLAAAGDKGKKAILALDSEARPAILALVESGGKNIERLISDFQRASGEAQRTAKTMGENFAGASARLSSAFDALRRALIDPILEPLAKQFDDVATRIRAFADTAEFGRIQKAVKDFALSATESIIQFVRSINFDDVSKRISEFATTARDWFASIGENAKALGDTLSIFGNTVSTVFNALKTAVFGAAAIITATLAGIAKAVIVTARTIAELQGAGQVAAAALQPIEEKVNGLLAVARAFGDAAKKGAEDTGKSLDRLGTSIEGAADKATQSAPAVAKVGDAGAKAADGVDKFNASLQLVPDYASGAADGVSQVPGPFRDVARDALLAAQHVTRFSAEAQNLGGGPISFLEEGLRQANAELSALNSSTERSPAALAEAVRAVNDWTAALRAARADAANSKAGVDGLAGSFSDLRITSQADLATAANTAQVAFEKIRASSDQSATGLADQRNAFIAYAQAALAAVAQGDSAAQSQAESQLRAQAAALGLTTQLEALIGRYKDLGEVSGGTNLQMQQAGTAGRKAFEGAKDAAKGASDAIEDAGKQAEAVVVSFASIGKASFKAVADMYSLVLARQASARDLEILIKTAEERLVAQRVQVDATVAAYNNLDEAALRAMSQAAGGADKAAANLQRMAAEAREGKSAFDELGQEDLSELASAADRAAQELARIAEEARSAKAELSDLGREFADQIDQIKGNERAIEDRKFQEDLERIAELAKRSGDANSAEAQQARAQAEELHQLRLQQIQEEEAERRRQQDGGGSGGGSTPSPTPPRPNGGNGGAGASQQPINVQNIYVLWDEESKERAARDYKKRLDRLTKLGG
jgi:TP901 family phage tail tape measure protein